MSNSFDKSTQTWDTKDVDHSGRNLPVHPPLKSRFGRGDTEMSEGTKYGSRGAVHGRTGNVTALASRALSVVASKSNGSLNDLDERWISRLVDAVLRYDWDARETYISDAIASGVSAEIMVDRYIPEAARRLGEDWCRDEKSFAEVTIGSARLQGMLRDLNNRISAPEPHATAAMIILDAAYHTLGGMVAISQFRRMGISVKSMIGLPPKEVVSMVNAAGFDAIFISASASEGLESIRELINDIKKHGNASVPIVVGGSVLNKNTDVKTLTGADYILNDTAEAVRSCGLMSPSAAAKTPAPLMER